MMTLSLALPSSWGWGGNYCDYNCLQHYVPILYNRSIQKRLILTRYPLLLRLVLLEKYNCVYYPSLMIVSRMYIWRALLTWLYNTNINLHNCHNIIQWVTDGWYDHDIVLKTIKIPATRDSKYTAVYLVNVLFRSNRKQQWAWGRNSVLVCKLFAQAFWWHPGICARISRATAVIYGA